MSTIAELEAQIAELTRERDILRARVEPLSARIKALSAEVVKLRPLAEQEGTEQERERILAEARAEAAEIIRQAKKEAKEEAKRVIREAKEREKAKKQAAREAARAAKEAEKAEREAMLARRPKLVRFTYLNSEYVLTDRTVEIGSAHEKRGEMYVQGYCHLRQALRTFRLDRIRGDVINLETGEVLTWFQLGRLWGLSGV